MLRSAAHPIATPLAPPRPPTPFPQESALALAHAHDIMGWALARANQNARIQPRCRTPSSGAPAHCIQHPHQRLKSKRPGPMMLSPALSSCMTELTLSPLMMSHGNAKPDHSDMATPEWPHVYYGGKHTDTTALKPLQTTTQPCPGKRPGKASKHAHTWGTTAPFWAAQAHRVHSCTAHGPWPSNAARAHASSSARGPFAGTMHHRGVQDIEAQHT